MTVVEFERWVMWFWGGLRNVKPEIYNTPNFLAIEWDTRKEIRDLGMIERHRRNS